MIDHHSDASALRAQYIRAATTAILSLCITSRLVAQDPIPDPITPSGLTVELIDIVQLPNTRTGGETGGIANTNILVHDGANPDRVYVNDMRGRIYLLQNDLLQMDPFLDLTDNANVRLRTNNIWQGFTTFAFHPDFSKPGAAGYGKLYTATDERPAGSPDLPSSRLPVAQHSVLAEWTVDPSNSHRIDPASRRELLRLAWPSLGHKMDQLAFNPNAAPGESDYGMLYLSLGDGGDTWNSHQDVDADRNGQATDTLFGTIARIDPLGSNGRTGQYGIPANNPFVGDVEFQPEIWAYGFRNPHRFSWDRTELGGDGTMYISDIGQASIEEISIGRAGGNYGWSEREGTFVVDHSDQHHVRPATAEEIAADNTIAPVIQYDHSEGRAIVGGYVMRGPNILNEHYIFGDIRNGRVFAANTKLLDNFEPLPMNAIDELLFSHQGQTKTMLEIVREIAPQASRVDLRFGHGFNGELYILSKQDGFVRRLNLSVPESSSLTLFVVGGMALFSIQRNNVVRTTQRS